MRIKLTTIAATGLLLAGCGGAKEEQDTSLTTDYSKLKATPQNTQGLTLADQTAVKTHIANGLRLRLSGGGNVYIDRGGVAAPSAGEDASAGGGSGGGYSQTNVHVDSVDEADVTKYDGNHWFIANQPHYSTYNVEGSRPSIQVVATDPAAPNAEIVGQLQFDEEWGNVGEMYLVSDGETTTHVASIRHQWGNVMPYLPGVPIDLQMDAGRPAPATGDEPINSLPYYPRPQNSKVRVQLLDVNVPTTPTEDWEVKIDGSLIDSRKVDNTLYLVTRFDPWLGDLIYEYGDATAREKNEKVIDEAELTELMPHYYIGDTKTPLSSGCFLQANTNEYFGYSHLVNITAIDLASQRVIGSTCLNSGVEALSMSPENLYLTGTVHDNSAGGEQTVVHKFALTPEGAQYIASGSVTGSLGWSSDPAFRMHEADDQLRIVTSQWQSSGPVHRLSILLDDKSGVLIPAATLPNEAYPAPIGKPGEDIYSVRFQGNTAYIVTFQRTDPLYAIDLSDPLNPRIAGELEIPGFATYMHPLPNDYLFTLGYDADDTGRTLGIKAELIKVTDGQPEVVNTLLLGGSGSHSEALSNLRALSVLTVSDEQVRFAFPVTLYENDYPTWQYSGLQLVQVDGLASGNAQLTDQGAIIAEMRSDTQEYPSGQGTVRGTLHGDAAFFTFNSAIWAAHWDAPQDAVGPIRAEPTVCTDQYVYGLHVTVTVEDADEADPCNARVSAMDGDAIEVLMPDENSRNGNSCTFYGAGEAPGFYLVTASLPGLQEASTKVEVYSDVCHVIPETIQLVLQDDPVACTAEARPSIQLKLTAMTANDVTPNLCDANVVATKNGEAYKLDALTPPMPSPIDEGTAPYCEFQGPYEVAGEFTVEVSLEGYEPLEIPGISVEKGECHVATQNLSAALTAQ